MDMYLLPSTAEFDDACHPTYYRPLPFAERIFDLESHIRICPLSWYLLREDFLDQLSAHIHFSMLDNARNTSALLSISVLRYGARTHNEVALGCTAALEKFLRSWCSALDGCYSTQSLP